MKNIPIRNINIPKDLAFTENFSIRDLSVLLSGKDMVQDIHRHDFFFMLVLKRGKGEHTIDFIPYKIQDHSVFFMRPGQVHKLKIKAGSTGFVIQFKKDFYSTADKDSRQLLRRVSNNNMYKHDAKKFLKIFSLVTDIIQEYEHKREKYLDVIKADLEILFIELLRDNKNDTDHTATINRDRLEEFSELLDANVSANKQPSYFAQKLNLTPYQLNTITKTSLGKTSSEFINEHIILEAKRYLLSTSNQVKEIAYHLGYDDVSYFIRFFKKHTGLSPEAFRSNFS
ncbi:MAG: helix-turn-helix domain-containing protein [Ignavibacteriales bacterium]|nr:MAG: helix-turn-helix domain-containing protein [Ignavibacteriales bacterium]